jgi:hypothetical protein
LLAQSEGESNPLVDRLASPGNGSRFEESDAESVTSPADRRLEMHRLKKLLGIGEDRREQLFAENHHTLHRWPSTPAG